MEKAVLLTHIECIAYAVEKVKECGDFYINIIDIARKGRLHVCTKLLDVVWYDVIAEVFDGTDYIPAFSYSANSPDELAVVVRKSGRELWDKYGYCKQFSWPMHEQEPCCVTIEKAVLAEPVAHEQFMAYFDQKILDDVRDKYGVELYNECLNLVCLKYGFDSILRNREETEMPAKDSIKRTVCRPHSR